MQTDESRDLAEGPTILDAAWRYRALVIAVTVIAGVGAYLHANSQTAEYQATARLNFTDPRSAGVFRAERGSTFVDIDRYLKTQAARIMTLPVAEEASELLDGRFGPGEIRAHTRASSVEDLNQVPVTVRHPDPRAASEIANAVAAAYEIVAAEDVQADAAEAQLQLEETIVELQSRLRDLESRLNRDPDNTSLRIERDAAMEQLVTVRFRGDQIKVDAALYGSGVEFIEPASTPGAPAYPQPRRNALIGGMLGLLASVAIAFWRAERRLRPDAKYAPAATLDAPLLAEIPEHRRRDLPVPTLAAPHSVAAEAYQFALTSLEFQLGDSPDHTILVTSSQPGDGKTVTTLNLAVAAARNGRRVMMIDADLRRQGLTRLCGLAGKPGLAEVTDDSEVPVQRPSGVAPSHPGDVLVMPAGTMHPDPVAFFGSTAFERALQQASESADIVFIDSPPLLTAAETMRIASHVDGVLLVALPVSDDKALREMRQRLEMGGANLLGYLLNRTNRHRKLYYDAYYTPDADTRVRFGLSAPGPGPEPKQVEAPRPVARGAFGSERRSS